ncbi:MAG: (d)CMP kinase [Nitrospirota bacterium]|nr:(d)CMP kinase [Nitrospirota bacterium]
MSRSIVQAQSDNAPVASAAQRRLIVTLDGPAGAGKSTVAKLLAARLGYLYLDTGALYRAVAWKVRAAGIDPADAAAVAGLLPTTKVALEYRPDRPLVFVDGRDVTDAIRTPEISQLASLVSAIPAVREWLLPVQRDIGAAGGIVAEGRDLGTRIFPQAQAKFFLDADLTTRAARRHRELAGAGHASELERTQQEIEDRDRQDRTRDVAPLVPAPDAVRVDSSTLTVDQVVNRLLDVIAIKL